MLMYDSCVMLVSDVPFVHLCSFFIFDVAAMQYKYNISAFKNHVAIVLLYCISICVVK